jgi:ferric-dicitrate binding protein FerR (iron transport regulator)
MSYQEKNTNIQEPGVDSLLAYIRGEASVEDTGQVERWRHTDEANEKAILQIASLYFAQRRKQRIEQRNPLRAFNKTQRQIKIRTGRLRMTRWAVAAACISGVIILSTFISYLREPSVAPQQAQIVTVQSNAGMRSRFNLPDGTVVCLNSGSRLSYPVPFDAAERHVNLTGEAYFNVAHDSERPFIADVFDGKFRVKVLGTEFNLQAFDDDANANITLVSGQVNVTAKGPGNKVYEHILSPSEKVAYNTLTGEIRVEKVNTQYETGWIEGKLMFKNSPLPEVLKKLSYFYNVKFEVRNNAINNHRFTGTFENRQLFQVLDYLQISSDIKYRVNQVTEDDSQGIKQTAVTLE